MSKNPKKTPVWEMPLAQQKDDRTVVFDYDELLEFAEGNIAPVFGPAFSIIDSYPRRVRLPARDYLLVSRVTKLDALPNQFTVGASMTTEYDLPVNGELSLGGDIPWAILVESGQCDLMLISYMGIDFQCKGKRVYRLLDTTLTFYGVASEGETLVYDIRVNGFAKGAGGEVSMFFFDYDCYCNGALLIEMRGGAAGFFTDEELAAGKGCVRTRKEEEQRRRTVKQDVTPFLVRPCLGKTTFSEADMQKLVQQRWAEVLPGLGEVSYRLATPKMLMIDRITHLDPRGGVHGLGLLVGEKILERDHWYFPCHFVKDEVLAGSLVSDGCSQLLKVYMLWLGLHRGRGSEAWQFRPVDGNPNKVRCRGQISPHRGKLVYVMEIREMGFDANGDPYAIADVDILDVDYEKGQRFERVEEVEQYGKGDLNKKIVVDFKGIALRLQSRNNGANDADANKDDERASLARVEVPREEELGDEVTWHPLREVLQKSEDVAVPRFHFYPSKFPPRPICFTPFLKSLARYKEAKTSSSSKRCELREILHEQDLNFAPGELPLNFYNMCEFMCGKVSSCLGAEFAKFDVSSTSRSPAFDLAYVTRVLKVSGMVRRETLGVDVDPGKGEMIAEFDCPSDAWFFQGIPGGEGDGHLPYSIVMEIALQTSGVLTSWLKAPLTMKQKDILFRNLDACAELLRKVDLRGKTIINRSRCTGYNMLGKMGIHRFTFELFVKDSKKVDPEMEQLGLQEYLDQYEQVNHLDDGKNEPFYVGETSFGWFVPEVFESQVGLDNGKKREPLFLEERLPVETFSAINTPQGKEAFCKGDAAKRALLRRTAQSEYVEEIHLGEGYAHGGKTVDLGDWFFSCHFWNDSVMPGSLGLESMFQLMEFYILHKDLHKQLAAGADGALRWEHVPGKTAWKYRGQLSVKNKRMDSEVRIVSLEVTPQGVDIRADGCLFVDGLRVYEAKDLRLRLSISASPSPEQKKIKLVKEEEEEVSLAQLKQKLLTLSSPLGIRTSNGKIYTGSSGKCVNVIRPVEVKDLGDASFMRFYGVEANLYTGAMAKGIASADLVIAMGQARMLASFGAGGLPMHVVEKALTQIKAALHDHLPFAVNLIHSPFDPNLEEGNVALFKKYGVNIVEASAFMNLTLPAVEYRVSGLKVLKEGVVEIGNKLISKCSRTEVAEMFLQPPPLKMLDALLAQGKITKEQHEVAQWIPLADDVAIEADSGGHTDNRQLHVILPLVINLRNRLYKESCERLKGKRLRLVTRAGSGELVELAFPYRTRVGAGGGIGAPQAVACAHALGAAFVVTGTINQLCRQSGTCDTVRGYLSTASYSDVTMAPAADMFDQGVQLQVLKKGTMFPSRAKKLYEVFCKYDSFEAMPAEEVAALEKRILKKSIAEVWQETKDFYVTRLHNPEKIQRAETSDPKLKMSLCFRWYLGLSSFWANAGIEDRKTDYQIWCGPAIGAFNDFIEGSYLDVKVSGEFPDAVQANLHLLRGACYLARVAQIKAFGDLDIDVFDPELATYKPEQRVSI